MKKEYLTDFTGNIYYYVTYTLLLCIKKYEYIK